MFSREKVDELSKTDSGLKNREFSVISVSVETDKSKTGVAVFVLFITDT